MSMEKMEFDPMLEADKARKDLKKEQAVKSAGLTLEESVYNPKTGGSDLVENLPFAKNEGRIILEKDETIKEIAKAQILPLSNILEAEKENLTKEDTEGLPENIED